ncbi:50S ribosomal protein L19 [Candidatus Curtissbacteria bacterium RIFCSPHIGHO2_02_FULL_40_17]|uniref:50S ribosomal protein L19 n=4 Tax=Candidatus Curtissiibacteriota TaxID=1752717 RepID=A0A1F5GH12_9BACT|nr:MAG: 50S ribosomal protein L19 [Candidatus Curtissbacteria bacterium RIFCSPHIGHO2_01_FULL_40_12]OGD91152.1 MAG: 50S ribosomal protein L19 [Candidatus Curtissbacteria bacterium RIFCSPHIGHO2_02_FULL_40_17]OGE05649.1 MAG: 50S ribosomal protein L19 [Candidatus Curtissbacteria bacterium RIFCSPHIGHO2_12_FULL_41_17]OGE07142.1 MAG: 50S ribosomal protein L19 [Candidatus Curtissbacteria bacterium RIFCSPLOWO2_02_FULL_40_13b]
MKNNIFEVGDTVKVTFKAPDGAKIRVTPFDGRVIAYRGTGGSKTFTVRKVMSSNVAVERIFPVDSPLIEHVKVIKKEKVRRAKLYYLRRK